MTAGEPFTKIVVVEDDAPDTGDLFDVGDVLKRSIRSIIEDEFEVPIRKEQLVAKSVAQFLDYLGLDTTPRHGGPGSNSTFDSLLKRYGESPMNIVEIAKAAIAGDTTGLAGVVSAAEYMGAIHKAAAAIRQPGESQAQAFARYTRDEHHGGMYPDGPILLKAATRHAQDVNPELRKAYRPDPVTSPAASRDDLMREHIFPRVEKIMHDGESVEQALLRWMETDPEAALLAKALGGKMPDEVAAVRKTTFPSQAPTEPRVIATGADIASDPNSMDRAAEIAQVMAIRPWMTVTQAAVYVERMRQAVQRATRRGGDAYSPDMSSPGRLGHSPARSSPGRP